MKYNLFLLFFLWISVSVFSQESTDKIVYLDSFRNETKVDNHDSYRVVKDYYLEKNEYHVFEYFSNGNIKLEYQSSNKDYPVYEGKKTEYFENGKSKYISYFTKSYPTGQYKSFYSDGSPNEEGEFVESSDKFLKKYKMNQFWDVFKKQIVIDGNGIYDFCTEQNYCEKGNYLNGFKDGIFEGEDKSGQISRKEIYKNGAFVSGICTKNDGLQVEYFDLEKKPEPKKGMKDFYGFIGSNFTYTQEAIKNKVEGTIIINFVINVDGKIIEPKINKSLGFGLDEEAIRILLLYGKWNPGQQRGLNVRCSYSLPLKIKQYK